MTTQLCLVRTRLDLATLAAMVAAGLLGTPSRRVLVVADVVEVPETSPRLADEPGFGTLAAGFDDLVDYNDAVHPNHPGVWRPRQTEEPMWERYFRAVWGLGSRPLEVVAPDLHLAPGSSLAVVFADARVLGYLAGPPGRADSPAPAGPPNHVELAPPGKARTRLPVRLARRVEQLPYLDPAPMLVAIGLAAWGRIPTPNAEQRPGRKNTGAHLRASLGSLAREGLGLTSLARRLLARLPWRRPPPG
ncbi:MAG: hypothetical protein ACOH1Y_11675 [Propionicimonas sp.]